MKKEDIAKHVFVRNPKLEAVHVTSDGQCFHTEHQADGHAQRLKDRKVESFKKNAEEPETDDVDTDAIDAATKRVEYAKTLGIETEKIETEEELEDAIDAAEDVININAAADKAQRTLADNKAADAAKDLEVVTDDDATGSKDVPEEYPTVKVAEAEIKKINSLEELAAVEAVELAGQDRTGVKNAIAERRAELVKQSN